MHDYYRSSSADSIRWWDVLPVRDRIDRLTRSIDDRYWLTFGDGPRKINGQECSTGVTMFDQQECWVNANCIPSMGVTDQIVYTVYLAAHERAHARYTQFKKEHLCILDDKGEKVKTRRGEDTFDINLMNVFNILEDERIERLIGRDFPHLHGYLRDGSKSFLTIIPPVPEGDPRPSAVLGWVLRNRVAVRAGTPETCPLTPENTALLNTIQPLLDEAFSCDNSERVIEISREILKILNMDTWENACQIASLLSGLSGARQAGDNAEQDGDSQGDGNDLYNAGTSDKLMEDVKDLLKQSGYTPGQKMQGVVPAAPYEALLNEVLPYVAPLRQVFQAPPTVRRVEYEESGSRLSLRAARTTPKTPFRVETDPLRFGKVTMSIVVDDSASMAGSSEHHAKRAAMMAHEALSGNNHDFRMTLAPSGRQVANKSLREMSRAFIAGYDSPCGTRYAEVMKQEMDALLRAPREHIKYLILVADGQSGDTDQEECRALVKKGNRKGIISLGIGIGIGQDGGDFFRGIFDNNYVGMDSAAQLVSRLQNVMQRITRDPRFARRSRR